MASSETSGASVSLRSSTSSVIMPERVVFNSEKKSEESPEENERKMKPGRPFSQTKLIFLPFSERILFNGMKKESQSLHFKGM